MIYKLIMYKSLLKQAVDVLKNQESDDADAMAKIIEKEIKWKSRARSKNQKKRN